MRLTEKGLNIHKTSRYATSPEVYNIYDKLSKLEDIEDELGIDLVTLFKVLKGGIFVDGDSTHKYVFLDVNEKELFTINDFECAYFAASLSQYGKTWALTKEELEGKNEKGR